MKSIVREHIQQLDVSLGGGIVSDKIRVDTIDNPMLVIGLGGTGIDALLRVKYQINRSFKLPEDNLTKKRKEKPDNIEFLAFETNEQDKGKKYPSIDNGIGLDLDSELVLLSNAEVGSLLQNRSILEDYITDWLSPELSISDGMKGACGNRQAGRLLLFTKITQVVESIRKKINILSEGRDKKLVVFILTGITGGTGSGCFLDIAYIVRGIMDNKYGNKGVDKVDILGYVFTPDVNLSKRDLSLHTQEYIQKNGYAALKELDYWMNAEAREEKFKQRYGNVLTVNSPLPPFNLCHLISATNTNGKFLENAYDYCMNVTAENIVNFMANEEKASGAEFAIHDYISNISMNIAQMPKPYAANYKYNIIGASAAILPIEEITTYLAYRLFKKIEKMFQSAPEKEDVDNFVRKLGMDCNSISMRFEDKIPEALPGYENSERLSHYNVIKTQAVNLDTELEQEYLSRARTEYIKTKKQLPNEILERFREDVKRTFINASYGPIYISRFIYTPKGFCLLETIGSYIEGLKADIQRIPMDIKGQENSALELMTEARSAIISKNSKKNAYIKAKIDQYKLKADEIRMTNMVEFYEDVYNLLNDDNNKIYNIFTEVLNTLNQIFDKNANILVDSQEAIDNKSNKTYHWNVISVPDVVKVVDGIMKEKDVDELLRDFLKEMLYHSDKWIKEKEIDILGSISDFISDKFGDLITRSMEDFLTIRYGQDEMLDQIVKRRIANKLDENAIPVFHLSNSSGEGIKAYQTEAIGKSNSKFNIKESTMTNRIFWLNTMNGIPLFAYSPMQLYEECYERTIMEKEGVGRHLVQTEKLNWVNMPSPIPEKSWGDTYENRRVKALNANSRELFAKAKQQGCLVEKESSNNTSNRFECIITKEFDITKLLSKYELSLNTEGKPNFTTLGNCLKELKDLLAAGLEIDYRRSIFDSHNEEFAKENFLRSPQLIKLLEEELEKYDTIKKKINEFERLLTTIESENKLLDSFIELLYTNTISKKGVMYVYDKDIDEDMMEPFVNLLEVKKYPEYVLFSNFVKLDEKRKIILAKKNEKRKKVLFAAEDTTVMVNKLNELESVFTKRKEVLDYEFSEMPDGDKIYEFYKRILIMIKDIKQNIQ
ncbi:MAG: tubulin-like doman-containing protein [Ruminiclostridium sp.]